MLFLTFLLGCICVKIIGMLSFYYRTRLKTVEVHDISQTFSIVYNLTSFNYPDLQELTMYLQIACEPNVKFMAMDQSVHIFTVSSSMASPIKL